MTKKIGKYKPIKSFIMKKSLVFLFVAALQVISFADARPVIMEYYENAQSPRSC